MSKKERAYEFLRSQILNGTYGPGYRIIIDRTCQELEVSSSPVREAIQQLVAEGLVEIIPYSGAIVKRFNECDYAEVMFVLGILEGGATALASKFLTESDLQKLEATNQSIEQAVAELDLVKAAELNVQFHAIIHERCGNNFLIGKVKQTWQRLSQLRIAGFPYTPKRIPMSIMEHKELIRLIRERAPGARIEEFIRQHKQAMVEAVQSRAKLERARQL
ncbi:hypothetical protein SRRS_33240 [Sporomusa rhizae]|uniref:GntR family transcriptional regulator n=1 Tax=Sporomusa rhizae TaxID=357999 RepID=UPI00352A81FE